MFWDDKYIPLSTYNTEVSRGILHTDEYKKRMKIMQEEFMEEMTEHAISQGIINPSIHQTF